MELRTIAKNLIIVASVAISTPASALVINNPNSIYMIGASVNAQLYNEYELTSAGHFDVNKGVVNKDNPLYFTHFVADKNKIFWGQIPNNFELHFLPATASTLSGMMKGYEDLFEKPHFVPTIPGYVLVGWVQSMCYPKNHSEGLNAIISRIDKLVSDTKASGRSTKIVLMKYPTEGLSFTCNGDYFSNANAYNVHTEELASNSKYSSVVRVIDPWKSYTTKFPGDTVHANDRTLKNAAIRIKDCFENDLPLSCKDKPQ